VRHQHHQAADRTTKNTTLMRYVARTGLSRYWVNNFTDKIICEDSQVGIFANIDSGG